MASAPQTLETPRTTLTVRDWAALDPDLGCELVNGQLARKADVAIWHDILVNRLVAYLYTYLRKNGLGELPGQKSRLRVSLMGGREPDLFFVPKDQFPLIGLNLFTGVPPLVIEVLSPSNEETDRIDKYEEYAQLGIPEYWIVDFPNRCFEVHRLKTRPGGGRAYELSETHRDDAVFRPALFPGLEIPLADVWPTEFENRNDL